MRRQGAVLLAGAMLCAGLRGRPAFAQVPAARDADAATVRATIDRFVDGWHKRDMVEFGSTIAVDCDWVNIVGMHWQGRETVVRAHKKLLETRYRGVDIHTVSADVSFLDADTALVIWKQRIDAYDAPDGKHVPPSDAIGTATMVRRDGQWVFRAFENVLIDPVAAQHDLSK